MTKIREGALVLVDGTAFEGELIGAEVDVTSGEVVFNTVLSGYQEVITDPSYAGQIINFTYPHIGNYGVTGADDEAKHPSCRGVVVRELARRRSNWRSEGDLDTYLRSEGIPGIAGVDTRRLTRHVRENGAMPAAMGSASVDLLAKAALSEPGTTGVDLVSTVTTPEAYEVEGGHVRVVAYDLGIKKSIVEQLSEIATVFVVPAQTTSDEVLALGGKSYKMKFGHHGGNVPVRNLDNGRIEITSQNHNFAIESGSVPGVTETHVCLNDGALEGLRCNDIPAFSVQYHPEASPGPHDSRYLFEQFADLMTSFHGNLK